MRVLKVTGPDLLTPAEVYGAFRVHPRTLTTWARAGKIPSIRTPGGHRRFRRDDVQALLNARLVQRVTP